MFEKNIFCLFLATGFNIGYFSKIPGTIASLITIPIWYIILELNSKKFCYILIFFFIFLGFFLCHYANKNFTHHDDKKIIFDEFVGMWITLNGIPEVNLKWIITSLLMFRILDIFKPWPISYFHKLLKLPAGINIMIDDIIAGIFSYIFLLFLINYFY